MKVWDFFERKQMGDVNVSNPTSDWTPDIMVCKICKEEIPVQMCGGQSIYERSFYDKATDVLRDHLMLSHSEVERIDFAKNSKEHKE